MSSENSELQDIHCIKKIEKQVASLAMERALTFVLKYHEGKQKSYNPPVSGKALHAYRCCHPNIHQLEMKYLRLMNSEKNKPQSDDCAYYAL